MGGRAGGMSAAPAALFSHSQRCCIFLKPCEGSWEVAGAIAPVPGGVRRCQASPRPAAWSMRLPRRTWSRPDACQAE